MEELWWEGRRRDLNPASRLHRQMEKVAILKEFKDFVA